MKTVYFVRHGTTEGNEQGAYQHAHTPLSELGRRQAAFVARRFERIPVKIVIASDMERAAETGRCIAERNRLPMVVDPLFHEILWPVILRGKGRETPEALEMMRFLAEHWTHAGVKHSDEENFFDLKTRALKALDHLVERQEKALLVVTRDFHVHADLLHDGGGRGQSAAVRSHPSFSCLEKHGPQRV